MKFNKLIPELSVLNIEKSMKFYVGILGFKIEYERKESKFVFLSFQGSQIMIDEITGHDPVWETGKMEYPLGRGVNFQIEVRNINKLVNALEKHKYPLRMQPKENWYRKGNKSLGNREFMVLDPDGYLLRFAEDIGSKPIRKK